MSKAIAKKTAKPVAKKIEKKPVKKIVEKKKEPVKEVKAEKILEKKIEEKKTEKAGEKKTVKAKEKPAKPKAKAKIRKEKLLKKVLKKIGKKRHPTFRGRFGKKSQRRIKKAKWAKWKKPRGQDIKKHREYGKHVDSGFRTNKKIRFMHPIGLREKLIKNLRELNEVKEKNIALRIASKLGTRKRKQIIGEAKKRGLIVLNP